MSRLEEELKATRDEVTYFQRKFYSIQQARSSSESEQLASQRRIVGELSEAVGVEKAEVQQLKLQLIYERQAIKDAEAESKVLRKQWWELEA